MPQFGLRYPRYRGLFWAYKSKLFEPIFPEKLIGTLDIYEPISSPLGANILLFFSLKRSQIEFWPENEKVKSPVVYTGVNWADQFTIP
jgi:hypothetical protein